jgi:hypothetical protein
MLRQVLGTGGDFELRQKDAGDPLLVCLVRGKARLYLLAGGACCPIRGFAPEPPLALLIARLPQKDRIWRVIVKRTTMPRGEVCPRGDSYGWSRCARDSNKQCRCIWFL